MNAKFKKRVTDPDANNPDVVSQPAQRLKRVRENLKLLEECEERGQKLSPVVYYQDDPVFEEFVKRESEAKRMLSVENDIIVALTFLRWKQENPDKAGGVSSELDYSSVEY